MISTRLPKRPASGIIAATLLMLATFMPLSPAFAAGEDDEVIHQLRIYKLFDATRDAFHERFRDHAQRIMARYDFNIVAMWESRADGNIEFVYLLQWPDEKTMKNRWEAFMADQEWADIKAETGRIHGQFVGGIEDRTLLPTDYSPNESLPTAR
jgi:hypothetical protein